MTTTSINTGVNSLSAAIATEIENGVTLYEFNSEAETEAAVMECVEKGIKFNTTGRRSLVIYQPAPAVAETYSVTYGAEEIAHFDDESDARKFAEGEAMAEKTILRVRRKSDNGVIAVYDFTETTTHSNDTTMKEETNAPQEYSHAAHCLDVYLNNTAEIYNRFTVPAIDRIAKAYKAGEMVCADPEHFAKDVQEIAPALQAAARLVRKHDHMTPTPADIEAVRADYVAYIIECAQYEVNNA